MEKKQLIISVSREYGSGGHVIAKYLAERFKLPYYDYHLLQEIADDKNLSVENLRQYDERPKSKLFSRTVRGLSNSPEEMIANMQFEYLRKKAEEKESFVIVGRCSETILKGTPGLITIFIMGDRAEKVKRTADTKEISLEEAEELVDYHDKKRRDYHNYYSDWKWGDSRNYDLCINSTRLGMDVTTDVLEDYIRKRMQ